MNVKKVIYSALFFFFVVSCSKDDEGGLTNNEIDLGIKTVLTIGIDSSITSITVYDGFLYDKHLELLLPNEGRIISDVVDWYSLHSNKFAQFRDLNINLNYYHQKSIQSLRNAAKSTSKEIDTLLRAQVGTLKYTNGQSIINGVVKNKVDSNAILSCFQSYAADTLYRSYQPKIKVELTKPMVGTDSNSFAYWATLVDKYNLIAERARQILINDSVIGGGFLNDDEKLNLKKFVQLPDTTILDEYMSAAVFQGIYNKMGYIEKQIRINPVLWNGKSNGDILQKAFRR
jgi:hypothetical protein